MTALNFADKILIEQVRHLEEAAESAGQESAVALQTVPIDLATELGGQSFPAALLTRAQAMTRANDCQNDIDKPAKLHSMLLKAAFVLVALLGFLAVANALSSGSDDQHAINIYWLLIVLLGFNLLSIALWCVGSLTKIGDLISGSIAKLPLSVFKKLAIGKQPAARAWYAGHYREHYGLWHISTLNHSLWLVYLCAGLFSLILFLSAQQYDFYWGSTLLSADTFLSLTNTLAAPLAAVGFAVPDASQISMSREGLGNASAVTRQQWAMFLIGALLLYGLLPRFVCWLVAHSCKRRAAVQFSPDFYQPYYVDLRHQATPVATASVVVDPDDLTELRQQDQAVNAGKSVLDSAWQAQCLRIGLELVETRNTVAIESVALNVIDKNSFEKSLSMVASKRAVNGVAVLVSDAQAPDRGIQRQLKALLENNKNAWLILLGSELEEGSGGGQDKQRMADWYKAAQLANVDSARVQYLAKGDIMQLASLSPNGASL